MTQKLELAKIFTSNMVLQRNKPLKIWGKAESGSRVTVEFNQVRIETIANTDKWEVHFAPLASGGPLTLTVSTINETITLDNIVMGEVWVAGGQSNMEMPLFATESYEQEIVENPDLRFFTVPRRFQEDIIYDAWHFIRTKNTDASWELGTKETIAQFSAVGYYFAKKLYANLNVPIGVISCNWGGTPAQTWIGQDYLLNNPELAEIMHDYHKFISELDHEKYQEELNNYLKSMAEWLDTYEFSNTFPARPLFPNGPSHPNRPGGLYQTMVRPLFPLSVGGVIWYQGESDTGSNKAVKLYYELFKTLIQNWREGFQDENLPFYFVQLTSYGSAWINPNGTLWAGLREVQAKIAKTVPNTGMVVTLDCGDKDDIHPRVKKPLGERLALLALNNVYNIPVACQRPTYLRHEIINDKVRVYFDNIGSGLVGTEENLAGFELAGVDGVYHEAVAILDNNTVICFSDNVKEPVNIRYAWKNYPEVSLYNKEGLLVAPFRTDNFLCTR